MKRKTLLFAVAVLAAIMLCILSGCSDEPKVDVNAYKEDWTDEELRVVYEVPEDAVVFSLPKYDTNKSEEYFNLQKAIRTLLVASLEDYPQEIYVFRGNYLLIDIIYQDISEAGVFWIDEEDTEYSMISTDNRTVPESIKISLKYDIPENELAQARAETERVRNEIFSLFPAEADDWEKALIIHDELVRRVTYDQSLSEENIRDYYGALVKGRAVCDGYAKAFAYLVKELGIYCNRPISDIHAWNRLHVMHSYDEMVDSTWDDPDMCDATGKPYVLRDYFFITLDEASGIEAHSISWTYDAGSTTLFGDVERANYHYKKGYVLSSASVGSIGNIFAQQYREGENVLTVRFDNADAYAAAKNMCDNGDIGYAIANTGYSGSCAWLLNDPLQIVNILLNPAA